MDLGKIPGFGAAIELVNGRLRDVLPPCNVNGGDDAILAPSPARYRRETSLSHPSTERNRPGR